MTETGFVVPGSRLIRKRIAARTTAVHLSALRPELQAMLSGQTRVHDGYLRRRAIPAQVSIESPKGGGATLSRDDVWALVDRAGADLEADLLSGRAGKVAAFFSATGQGVYADYGRPTMDFAGFFRDYVSHGVVDARIGRVTASSVPSGVQLGPLLIAADAAGAAGLTALGHIARRAELTHSAIITDVVSTGLYEGASAWASAKIGVAAGAKTLRFIGAIPIPGARPAAILIGFVVGAAAAIAAKRVANRLKDAAVDSALDTKHVGRTAQKRLRRTGSRAAPQYAVPR